MAAVVVGAVLLATACGDGDSGQSAGGATGSGATGVGHAALRFSGAVSGSFDSPIEVACYTPVEDSDRFTVSIDSDTGVPVGPTRFLSMDVAVPGYRRPSTYTLKGDPSGGGVDPEDFFLLFQAFEREPFGWDDTTEGTITVDDGETSGRLSLRRWRNASGDEVAVDGTFRCGRKP